MDKPGCSKWKFNRTVQKELNNLSLLRTDSTTNLTNNNAFVNEIQQFYPTLISESIVNHELENISELTVNEIPNETYQSNNLDSTILFNANASTNTSFNFSNTEDCQNNHCNSLLNKLPLSSQIEQYLKLWAVKNKITQIALKELLEIVGMIPEFKDMPKDPRTFLKTPRRTITRKVDPGSYFHLGINNGLNSMFKHIDLIHVPDIIEVGINIDGLPLFKSSSDQLYPILCLVNNVKIKPNVFSIGIYHGLEKPKDFNDFLSDFVEEATQLTTDGLLIKEKHVKFKINMFLFDAVAKASILYIKGHSGYSSCTKCTQEGDYICNRVCFPDLNFTKRTDFDFIAQTDPDHHVGKSILEKIPLFCPVTEVPLDYMHLICLGVVKKFVVSTWCYGHPPHKLSSNNIITVSNALVSLTDFVPVEFARIPRSLKECKRWKATEFRQFILYTGPLVLKDILDNAKYNHFLSLHVATRILLSDKYNLYIDYAEELLNHFVLCTKHLYGLEFLTHNMHNLLHITDDVKKFGNMNIFSNFSAENHLQKLKKLVKKSHHILP